MVDIKSQVKVAVTVYDTCQFNSSQEDFLKMKTNGRQRQKLGQIPGRIRSMHGNDYSDLFQALKR